MLTNFDIDKLMSSSGGRRNKKYAGCYTKDQLKELGAPEAKVYIVNIQSSNEGNGTHWTLVSNLNPNRILYVDPLGAVCPDETLAFMKLAKNPKTNKRKDVVQSTWDFQDIKASTCGWWSVWISKQLMRGISFLRICSEIDLFNTWRNEQLIKRFMQAKSYLLYS